MKRIFIIVALMAFSSAAHAQQVNVTLSEWQIDMKRDTMPAGRFTFQVKNEGTMTHGFQIKGASIDTGTRDLAKGEVASMTLTLKPGTYELFCPMAENSHKLAGMTRKLVVTAAAPKPPEEALRQRPRVK